ncbi:MAG: hypothetical protein H0W84_10560 [Bacteroidetes bacterium]|nr:hypothetical protein [Bacteroidota bacterium]
MKESNKLFELIKSMSATEKAYFKKYTSMHVLGKENNYVRLFDAFAAQEEFDEIKIKKALKNRPVLKYFASSQDYLYKLIMKCLRAYHNDEYDETRLLELQINSILLQYRGLLEHSNKMLDSAKDLSRKNEDLISELKIYDLERINYFKKPDRKKSEVMEKKLFPAMVELTGKINEKNEIVGLYTQSYHLYLKYGENTSDKEVIQLVRKILDNPLLLKTRKYNTLSDFYYALSIKNYLYFILGDYPSQLENNSIMLNYLEKDPSFQTELTTYNYGRMLCNRMGICIRLGMPEELKGLFKKISLLKVKVVQHCILLADAYEKLLVAYIEFDMIEKGLALIPEIVKNIKQIERTASEENMFILQANIATVYFVAGEYSNSLKWINKILNNINKNIRQDLYKDVKMLNILVHYELKNFEFMDSLIISLHRLLIRENSLDKFSKAIFNHMKKLAFIMDKKEIKDQLLVFSNELKVITKNEIDKKTYVIRWIEKKLDSQMSDEKTARVTNVL